MSHLRNSSLARVALQGTLLVATVDRIEGEHAVLEWSEGSWSSLPVQLLPPGVREGDRLRLRLHRKRVRGLRTSPPQRTLPDDFFVESTHGVSIHPSSQAPQCAHPETPC